MSGRQSTKRTPQSELVREAYDALDLLEERLKKLPTAVGRFEALELVLALRRRMSQEFAHPDGGAAAENSAS